MTLYWKLLPYARHQTRTIAQASACTLAFVACWPLIAWLVKPLTQAVGNGDLPTSLRFAAIAAGIFLVQKIAQYGQDLLMAAAALEIACTLRKRVFGRLQALGVDYFAAARTGDLSYRLTEDIDRIGEAINKVFHQFLPSVLQLVAVLAYVIVVNWQLTLALLAIAPLMAFLIGWFGERVQSLSQRSQSRISDLSAFLSEIFGGIRTVKAFAADRYFATQFGRAADRNRQAKLAADRLKAIQFPVVGFLEALSVLLLFLLGSWQISLGNLTGSEFISYGAAVLMLIDPIAIVTSNFNEFKQGEASVARILELLALEPSVVEAPEAIALPPVTGKVEFHQVSFAYPQSPQPILQNLSFRAAPGERIALVGASGAGKTTLVNLLPRFYDPQSGQILLDGTDIKTATLASLRQQIGIVPQEIVLFAGSIAQNIAFGREDLDFAAIEAAAKVANAHQFISELSDGYRALLGERGATLSGGQRQRLAIARAVLLDPKILILDEATSALDAESEALVQEALERLTANRTTFVIAHRLATIRNADRILVLKDGRAIETGTHKELMARSGYYSQLHARQFGN